MGIIQTPADSGGLLGSFANMSPWQQGLLALSNGLIKAGQPSPYKMNLGQAFTGALPAMTDTVRNASSRQQINDMLQKGDIKGFTAAAIQSPDPEMQKLGMQTKLQAFIPQWGETKDAMGNPIAYNKADPSQVQPIGGNPMGLSTGAGGGQADTTLKGDDYLKQLPPQIGTQVKALAEGRMQFPGGFALKSPYWQQMISHVSNYDPNFDAVNYNARAKTRADYTSGKTSQNIKSIETALNTLAQAKDASDSIGGVDNASVLNTPLNLAYSKFLGAEGSPELNTYNTLAKTAADETTRAVVGAGGTGADRQTREEQFGVGQAPKARNASLTTAAQELAARLDPVANMYNQGMGTTKGGIDLLSPQAQAAYYKLTGQPPANATAAGQKPLQQTPVKAVMPPAGAIAHLKANPALAKDFEAKYGVSAKTYLGQ
jgi:hypothetical protein